MPKPKFTRWKITDILKALIEDAKGPRRDDFDEALRLAVGLVFEADPALWLRGRNVSIARPLNYTPKQWEGMTDDQRAYQLVKAAKRLNVPKRAL